MELRSVLKVVLIGMFAYICIMPVTIAWLTILDNIRAIPEDFVDASFPVLYYGLRFGLFVTVGLVVGRRVAGLRVANATLAGVFLAIGVMFLDTAILLLIPKRPVPAGYVPAPSEGLFTSVYAPLIWFGLQVILAAVGGWIAKWRVKVERVDSN